jgi:hypothetical protein
MAQANTYQGWVKFQFNFFSTHRQSFNLRYTHGYAGGGPVTKDAIQANRQMVFLDGVDFLVSGHTHDAWHLTYRREILHPNGRTYLRDVECLKCPRIQRRVFLRRRLGGRQGSPTQTARWVVDQVLPRRTTSSNTSFIGRSSSRFQFHQGKSLRHIRKRLDQSAQFVRIHPQGDAPLTRLSPRSSLNCRCAR